MFVWKHLSAQRKSKEMHIIYTCLYILSSFTMPAGCYPCVICNRHSNFTFHKSSSTIRLYGNYLAIVKYWILNLVIDTYLDSWQFSQYFKTGEPKLAVKVKNNYWQQLTCPKARFAYVRLALVRIGWVLRLGQDRLVMPILGLQ